LIWSAVKLFEPFGAPRAAFAFPFAPRALLGVGLSPRRRHPVAGGL
jgi:hypothetical protein